MFGQPRCILLLPELVHEPRRTLDVRKEEGDRATRQLAHEAEPTPRPQLPDEGAGNAALRLVPTMNS
jgi:hypothetical protein